MTTQITLLIGVIASTITIWMQVFSKNKDQTELLRITTISITLANTILAFATGKYIIGYLQSFTAFAELGMFIMQIIDRKQK